MNSISRMAMPPALGELLPTSPVTLADAGAAGGIHERWSALGNGVRVLGFEPDRRAYDSLPKRDDRVWVNAALADREGDVALLVTRHQTNTSLLTPNRSVVDHIYQNPSDFDVVNEVVVPCTTLDAVSLAKHIEITALKADTQGTELAILQGAEKCLGESLLAIELEVEFTPLYSGQSLFSDVDDFMRERGFMLFDLGNLLYHKWRRSRHVGGRKGQLLAADALYFRTPDSLRELSAAGRDPVQLLAHYWAVCWVYGYPDLAFETALDQLKGGLMPPVVSNDVKAWAEGVGRKRGGIEVRGRGRAASWMRRLADHVDSDHHSYWVNPLGNE